MNKVSARILLFNDCWEVRGKPRETALVVEDAATGWLTLIGTCAPRPCTRLPESCVVGVPKGAA